MNTKKCVPSGCGLIKDVSEFNKNRARKDGHDALCRQCQNASIRAIRQRIKDGEHTARTNPKLQADGQARFDAHLAGLGSVRVGVYINTHTPVAVRCPSGHVTERYPKDIYSGYGCKVCNNTGGINLTKLGRSVEGALAPRWLYVIRFTAGLWKVGVGTDSRVHAHTLPCNGGGVVLYQTLTTKAAAYVTEQRVLKGDLSEFNLDSDHVPEHYEGRTEFLSIDPTAHIRTLEHRVPLAADPDAADWHADFANNIVADEVEKQRTNAQHS